MIDVGLFEFLVGNMVSVVCVIPYSSIINYKFCCQQEIIKSLTSFADFNFNLKFASIYHQSSFLSIISSSSSVVGSIGVITATFGLHEAIGRLGVERRVLTAGANKLMYDPFRPVNEKDVAILQNLLNRLHENFKSHVNNSRGDRLVGDRDRLFSGEVWSGREAVELGLADGVHSVDSFIR